MFPVTISHDILIDREYRLFDHNNQKTYQKCFYDKNENKKYIINIKYYAIKDMEFWSPEVQFTIENSNSISIELVQWLNFSGKYHGITLDEVEDFIEFAFITLGGQNYENNYEFDIIKTYNEYYHKLALKKPELITRLTFEYIVEILINKGMSDSIINFNQLLKNKQYQLCLELIN